MNSFYQHFLRLEKVHTMGYISKRFCVQFPIRICIWTCWEYIIFSDHFLVIFWTLIFYNHFVNNYRIYSQPYSDRYSNQKWRHTNFWEYILFYELFLTSGNAGKMNSFLTLFWSIFWCQEILTRLLCWMKACL